MVVEATLCYTNERIGRTRATVFSTKLFLVALVGIEFIHLLTNSAGNRCGKEKLEALCRQVPVAFWLLLGLYSLA